jgi:hypothetical protein
MSVLTLPALLSIEQAMDRMRKNLVEIDTIAISSDAILRDRAAQTKAWTFVWLAASLEEFVKKLNGYILDEITAQGIPCANLRISLFSVLSGNHFDGVKSDRGLPMWHKRLDALSMIDQPAMVAFDTTSIGLDRRTIRAKHFELIWRIFGFNGDPLPSPRKNYQAVLETLAEGRNDVAHGIEDPVVFGRRKTVTDVKRMVDQVEDIVDHVVLAADDYINNTSYLR